MQYPTLMNHHHMESEQPVKMEHSINKPKQQALPQRHICMLVSVYRGYRRTSNAHESASLRASPCTPTPTFSTLSGKRGM